MRESKIEWNVSVIAEDYEWLIDYSEDNGVVYVVSICADDIDWEERSVKYIHIENIDYLYSVEGEEGIDNAHELFKVIQREVVEEII